LRPAPNYLDEHQRNREDARTLYEIIQDQVVPLYYDRSKFGYSPRWVEKSKASMVSILTHFNTGRMLDEYLDHFYVPASAQGRRYGENGAALAHTISAWKEKVRAKWLGVRIRRLDQPMKRIKFGETMHLEVAVDLQGLADTDVCVELLLNRSISRTGVPVLPPFRFQCIGLLEGSREHHFVLELQPGLCGQLDYRIRLYPYHENLTHPFEMGLLTWL
jgi:starch phosphorylase